MRIERGRSHREILAPILLGVLFLGFLLAAYQLGMVEHSPNSELGSIAHTIRLDLESYALEHGWSYPRDAAAATEILPKVLIWMTTYRRLPPGRWGGQQRALLPICEHLGSAEHPTPVETILGKGLKVQDIKDCRHFGALLYDADPTGKHFVLYCIGKSNDQAIVRAVFRNEASRSQP